ncbi:SRPBCC family protein [Pseudonocardia sp.]|uniref:SRPBCC family protein n=1 Tax=Pseudonocardia sp. TaxID=60912 RepID=UPI00260BFC6E|nr:SRPBCC family protein [Pseudonocardia sp.]
MTQSLTTADGRCVLRMERRLRQAPARVWPALVEPARLADWFPSEVAIELRPGGTVTYGDGTRPGVVTDLDPPRLIAYTWDTDHLRWELSADGDGSLLTLTHTFDDRAGAASFAAGWHTCVVALGLALDGSPGADPEVDHRALHEQLLAELGLLDVTTTESASGWEIRLERQLIHPADVVWTALAPGEPGVGDPAPPVWPGAGAVTAVRAPELLEHDVASGGRVRWELGPGTGHGARLVLVRTAPDSTRPEDPRPQVAALLATLPDPAATSGTPVRT